jgi:hypothetical protein
LAISSRGGGKPKSSSRTEPIVRDRSYPGPPSIRPRARSIAALRPHMLSNPDVSQGAPVTLGLRLAVAFEHGP